MSWTGSEHQRRPQGVVECSERFRGNQRYVSESECRTRNSRPLAGLMPFGKYKKQQISSIPSGYLNWLLTIDGHDDLKSSVRAELHKRKENQNGRTTS
jgi:hypothetical protein